MNRLFSFFISIFFFSATAAFSQSLSKEAEARLLAFCELYSTVMYYYPEPNLQDFPWDAFAYQGYEMAITSESDEEFIQKTDSLFRIIAPGVQISRKEFDLSRITPKDTSLYPERVFWQHRGGLNVNGATFSNASTLNYIYKKPTTHYKLSQTMSAKAKGLLGRKIRFSLMAKVEGADDSVKVFSFYMQNIGEKVVEDGRTMSKVSGSEWREWKNNESKEAGYEADIKASGNEWKRYEVEIENPDSINFFRLTIYHPAKGAVYLDDLKLEWFEDGNWEEAAIPNGNFERYYSSGNPFAWETMSVFKTLVAADSIHAVEGKYCLKLPAVQDSSLYPPVPIEKPYVATLLYGYKAYVPLQLYADENNVFPTANKEIIKDFSKKEPLKVRQLAVACAMQVWAALYHDYPYRETGFENRISQLLLQTIRELETAETVNYATIIERYFLQWINDPHLNLERGNSILRDRTIDMKAVSMPVKAPHATILTENNWVVNNPQETNRAPALLVGDAILQINDINIDSVLQLYKMRNISRKIQNRELESLMITYGKPEMKVRLLRNDETIDVVFSTNTLQKGYSMMAKKKSEENQILQDSLKEATALFYVNAMYPPQAFNRSITRDMEKLRYEYNVVDSLITELNNYKALILDVRGRPDTDIISFFNQCMGVDLNRDSDVIKTAFYPIAQFEYDTLNFTTLNQRKDKLIHVPVYVLIDYHTMSAPERALISLKESKRATFIGSNTAGAAGFICKTKIADDISLVYTAGQVVGLDDNPMSYQGVGIPPDIYVYPTAQGIAEGRDEVLEKAIEAALDNL